MLLGSKIRELRDEQGLLQRQLAAALEIDTPMFSKKNFFNKPDEDLRLMLIEASESPPQEEENEA